MRIFYENKRFEKLYSDINKLRTEIGPQLAKKVKQRLGEFSAAENFGIYLETGLGKPHPLDGDLVDKYGVSLTGNIRIIIKPLVESNELSEIQKCKDIEIGGIVDYHGSKKNWYIK